MVRPSLCFILAGDPVGKGRPRIVRRGDHHAAITPEKTVRFESLIRDKAESMMRVHGLAPLKGQVKLEVRGFWTLAKSKSKKREPVPARYRTSKPDGDNLLKSIADALNGIAYLDDAQVVIASVEKWDAAQGEAGHTVVVVDSMEGEWGS